MADERKKVLIVDDEAYVLEGLTDKFSSEGFVVFQARNGKEGLEAALKEHPDIIILDVIMPVMDGMTMLASLRQDDWGKGVPIVMLTNLSGEEKVEEAMSKGTYDYLVKVDWSVDDVVKLVKKKLNL